MTTQSFVQRLSSSRENDESVEAERRTLESLVDSVDDNDTYRRGHSRRVAAYASNLARVMGSPPQEVALVKLAALVHDVGKIGIPQAVLRKSGKLTDAELHMIRLHPIIGASILSRMPGLEKVVQIVLHHHECWDGSAYPSRLKGVDIPIQSRIIFVTEAFDAIMSRSLSEAHAIDDALETLRQGSGKQFDPLAVDAMHEAWRSGMLDPAEAERPETLSL
jgi:putative nucleotidyltransferase with HDIG domain